MISIQNLTLILGKKTILDDVTVEFPAGQIYGLVGRNGSGKTMLMKCIAGFVRPTSGTIIIGGKLQKPRNEFPQNMGIIIETPGFLPYVSGFQNLSMLASLNKKIGAEQVRSSMRTLGLDPSLKLPVKKYSLGMKQRLGLAQAIMEQPDILILDEPFNGLDKDGVLQMRKFLQDYCTPSRLIVVASHNPEDIRILCDHVFEMEQGRLTRVEKDA